MIHLRHIISIVFILATYTAFSQGEPPVTDEDVLDNQKHVMVKEFPHLFEQSHITDVHAIDDKHTVVEYIRDSVYHEATINTGREEMLLVEKAAAIHQHDLPAIVQAKVEKSEYGDWGIERVFVARTPYDDAVYRIDVFNNPKKTYYVKRLYYDETGRYVEPPY